jgi:hypothetical protein
MFTVRDATVRLASMHGERFSDTFYWLYGAAILALVVTTMGIRRLYPSLATIGWITAGAALLWSSVQMPIY